MSFHAASKAATSYLDAAERDDGMLYDWNDQVVQQGKERAKVVL